jgi:hypothetical protein
MLWSLAALVGSVGFASAATQQTFADNFNDGICNPALWYVPGWVDAKLKENSQKLRFYSHPTNSALNQASEWDAIFNKKCNDGDSLTVSGKVRMPHMIPSDPGGPIVNSVEIGLGLNQSLTNNNCIELTVRDSQSNRQFVVYYLTETPEIEWEYRSFPAPTNLSVFNLKMSYFADTDTIRFFWADPKDNVWQKVCPNMKLSDLFGPALRRKMFPYVAGYTDNVTLPPEWEVWIDNFTAVYQDQPQS